MGPAILIEAQDQVTMLTLGNLLVECRLTGVY